MQQDPLDMPLITMNKLKFSSFNKQPNIYDVIQKVPTFNLGYNFFQLEWIYIRNAVNLWKYLSE